MAYKQTPARGKSNSYSSFQQKGFISPLKQKGKAVATAGNLVKLQPGAEFVQRPGDLIAQQYRAYNRGTANEPTNVNVSGGINVSRDPNTNAWVVRRSFTNSDGTTAATPPQPFSSLSDKERHNFSTASKRLKDQNFMNTPAYQQYQQNKLHSDQYFDTNTGTVKFHGREEGAKVEPK